MRQPPGRHDRVERIGIFGGTFNPPHIGHLICAQEACVRLRLDRILVMPAARPPHKPVAEEPGPEHRLALCRLAVADEERFEVSELEMNRPGASYTVDTLEALHSRTPDTELFLIVGGDAAAGLPEWREPERILELARLAVAERRGTARDAIEGALARLRPRDRAEFFPMPRIGLSSTMVRDRIRTGEPIRYLVTEPVSAYIEAHSLYAGSAQ